MYKNWENFSESVESGAEAFECVNCGRVHTQEELEEDVAYMGSSEAREMSEHICPICWRSRTFTGRWGHWQKGSHGGFGIQRITAITAVELCPNDENETRYLIREKLIPISGKSTYYNYVSEKVPEFIFFSKHSLKLGYEEPDKNWVNCVAEAISGI